MQKDRARNRTIRKVIVDLAAQYNVEFKQNILCQSDTNIGVSYMKPDGMLRNISLSHARRPGLQIHHFWVAKSLFLTITFNQKKQDKTFCF